MIENTSPIIIGCDHAAVQLKNIIKDYLETGKGITVEDAGAYDDVSVDYPDFGKYVAEAVSIGRMERGILLCGTGIGMSMVANRFPGVRAALCNDIFAARMSRRHNNANILVLGGRVIGDVLAMEIVDTWLTEPFEGGRHQSRLMKFDRITVDG